MPQGWFARSPGPWSVCSLTVLLSDKPGRNPSISSEDQEESLQASIYSSLYVFCQQQPSQTGQFPAVTTPCLSRAQLGKAAAWQGAFAQSLARSNMQAPLCRGLFAKH